MSIINNNSSIKKIYEEINLFTKVADKQKTISRIPYLTDYIAKLKGLHKFKEKEIFFLKHIIPRNRPALDIGSGSGLYTYHLLKQAKYCIAFEPRANAAATLKSRTRTWEKNIHVVNAAVSEDDSKTATLRVPNKSVGWSTIEKSNLLSPLKNESIKMFSVSTVTIDNMELQDVGFVKLDVEGHEISVLKGMRATINKFRPNFLMEVEDRHGGAGIKGIFTFMGNFYYDSYIVRNNTLKKITEKEYTVLYKDKKVFNAIFISKGQNI